MIHRAPETGILYGTAGYIDSLNRNTGFLTTKGIDFEANYESSLADWGVQNGGSLSVNFLGTWTRNYITEPVPASALMKAGVQPPYSADCAGLFGVICGPSLPAWRHKLRITWFSPWKAAFSLQWRHSSPVEFDANTRNPILNAVCGGPCGDSSDSRIGSNDYFDIAWSWNMTADTEIRAGINNIFDKDPPIMDATILGTPLENGNTTPENYDARGRTIFLAYTIKA
jgi:outer membrane receptor protein involved in Fe transport